MLLTYTTVTHANIFSVKFKLWYVCIDLLFQTWLVYCLGQMAPKEEFQVQTHLELMDSTERWMTSVILICISKLS